jgi:hypothetical protein
MVSRSRTLALQLNVILLCFSQTHLVRTGSREELGDVITRHNNGQATLFPHFLTLPTRNKIILNWKFTINLFFSDFQQDVNRWTYCIRTCYLAIRSCLVRWWRDGDDGKLALLKHVWMLWPEGAELVPVVAAWEDATEGEDHKKQESSPQWKAQCWPWGMLNRRHPNGWRRCQIICISCLLLILPVWLRAQTNKVMMRLGIYIWRAPYAAALARTKDGEKCDLHGQVGRTVRGTG